MLWSSAYSRRLSRMMSSKPTSPRLALTIFALLVLLFFVFRSLSHAFILSDSQDYEFIPDLPITELNFHSAYQDALQTAKSSATSRKWAPMVLSQCTPDMPTYFAPCLAERYLDSFRLAEEEVQKSPVQIYGEEIVYPDFALAPPLFVNEKQKERWLESARVQINERAYLRKEDNHMVYKGQHGQNFVLTNVSFSSSGFDSWTSTACTNPGTALHQQNIDVPDQTIQPHSGDEPVEDIHSVILVDSPDSWSFQHWLDRSTHVIAQASHLVDSISDIRVITGRRGAPRVQQLWKLLGFPPSHILHAPSPSRVFNLDHLVYSCKTVLIHPFLSWTAQERMYLPYTQDQTTDMTKKKKIVYMSRGNGLAMNGGRHVVNEDAVLDEIRNVLLERDQGEELVIFDDKSFTSTTELIMFLSTEVSAIIGPHGGALMNHRLAGPDVLLLEFLPTSRMEFVNHEEASILGQPYAVIITEPAPGSHDNMIIEPSDVRAILTQHLGVRRPDTIVPSYSWALE